MSLFALSCRRFLDTQKKRLPVRKRRSILALEPLESRQLLSGGVTIDSAWLAQNGPAPYLLDQADTTYTLATNVDVPETAFVVDAPNVTLNLNGNTVIYGDSTPLTVPNGGFEQGTSATDVPGWDLSGAPTAQRLPARLGMWGNYMLDISNFTTTQTLISSAVAIPAAGREYAATITPKSSAVASVELDVVDTVTGLTLAQGFSADSDRGFSAVTQFTPTTTDAVELRVIITPNAGATASVDLDYAALFASRDYGILATATWSGNLPSQLQSLPASYQDAANFTLENGSVIQGQGRSYAGDPLYFKNLSGLTVTGVTTSANGMDSLDLNGESTAGVTIQSSTFKATIDNILDRMLLFAAIYLSCPQGSVSVTGNTITGYPDVGISAYNNPAGSIVTISNNIIKDRSRVADAYGILVNALQNFTISNNTIVPAQGMGIMIDSWNSGISQNGSIYSNHVTVVAGGNLEYPASTTVIALRLRNNCDADNLSAHRNIHIYNNIFLAQAKGNGAWAAVGLRITEQNYNDFGDNSNLLIDHNTFVAITYAQASRAFAVTLDGIGNRTGLAISNNVLSSNDTSLALGDIDSWQETEAGVLFGHDTFTNPGRGLVLSCVAVDAGYGDNTDQRIQIIDAIYKSGSNWLWEYGTAKDIETGWFLTATVKNSAGAAVAGATVQIFNAAGQLVCSGTTNASGPGNQHSHCSNRIAAVDQRPDHDHEHAAGAFPDGCLPGDAYHQQDLHDERRPVADGGPWVANSGGFVVSVAYVLTPDRRLSRRSYRRRSGTLRFPRRKGGVGPCPTHVNICSNENAD
jgi:hypothetical protein